MKLGRLPRRFDPRVPHIRMALGLFGLPPPPPVSVDYTTGMPANLGVLLNDSLGDCTCAAMLHAQQVWSFNANPPMASVSDPEALAAYEAACGYDPKNPATDTGGDEQSVLTYWLNNPVAGNKLAAFVEIDVKNIDDVKRAIAECGLVYVGFDCPSYFSTLEAPGTAWHVQSGDQTVIGGHAVILAGYTDTGFIVISWGSKYVMGYDFYAKFMDEVYALVDSDWVEATGNTPGGIPLSMLEQQMSALKER